MKSKNTIGEINRALKMNMISSNKLKNLKFEWLHKDFLPKKSLVMLYGSAGSGKSFFALYLCKYLLENKKVKEVYYFDADNGEITLKNRKLDIIINQNPNLRYIESNNMNRYVLFKEMAKLDKNEFENKLILIDSIRNFVRDMQDEKEIVYFFSILQEIRNKGASIIFLHHQPKQKPDENNKNYKGVTAFLDSVDEGYFLSNKKTSKNELILLLEPQKLRHEVKAQAFKINTLNLSLEQTDYLAYSSNEKEILTIDLVKNILKQEESPINQKDLASKIKQKSKDDFIQIIGYNALWKLLERFNRIIWNIQVKETSNKVKVKYFSLIQKGQECKAQG